MSEPAPPTCDELAAYDNYEDSPDIEPVSRHSDPSWRHGTRETTVFHRKSDSTFWQACYRQSTDGETNELREGLATITRVYPHQVMTTVYKAEPPAAAFDDVPC